MVWAHVTRPLRRCVVLVWAGILPVSVVTPAFANYEPPKDSQPINGPRSGGPRTGGNCQSSSELALIALAPQASHAGQTISTQPTLTWFVPYEVPVSVTLVLYRATDDGLSYMDEIEVGQSYQGYMSYTLSTETALTVGDRYVWQVVLQCDPDDPSKDKLIAAGIEVVSPSASLGTVEGDRIQQAEQYAEAGLWYDALGVFAAPPLSEAERVARDQLLLELAEFEADYLSEQLQLVDQLQRITNLD